MKTSRKGKRLEALKAFALGAQQAAKIKGGCEPPNQGGGGGGGDSGGPMT